MNWYEALLVHFMVLMLAEQKPNRAEVTVGTGPQRYALGRGNNNWGCFVIPLQVEHIVCTPVPTKDDYPMVRIEFAHLDEDIIKIVIPI